MPNTNTNTNTNTNSNSNSNSNSPTWRFDFVFNDINTLLPRFGNWCGPGWPPQHISNPRPQGEADTTCRTHDNKYSAARGRPNEQLLILQADVELLRDLTQLNWARMSASEKTYVGLMALAFRTKIRYWDIPGVVANTLVNTANAAYQAITHQVGNLIGQSSTDAAGNHIRCDADAQGNPVIHCRKILASGDRVESTINTASRARTVTATSADGRSEQTRIDHNGDGVWDTFRVGLDTNHNGQINRFIDSGNSQQSILNADRQLQSLHRQGQLGSGLWNLYTDWSTNVLLNRDTQMCRPTDAAPNVPAIGAFYESRSAAYDAAQSIAGRLFRVLDQNGTGLTSAQLAARDANANGALEGAELDGLLAWRDLNEDGVLSLLAPAATANEYTSLRAALADSGQSRLRASDYALYTSGNADYRTVAQSTSEPPANGAVSGVPAPAAPESLYAVLRHTGNRFWISVSQWIDWAPTQIKISTDQHSMVGTENDDRFDIGYYATYNGVYFDLNRVQDFYAGGGHDTMGGSTRSDRLWGGTGNDTLLGYAGDDTLFGEAGNDELQGGQGNDRLEGGQGNDTLFGQAGNDTLFGGDGNDILLGFTGVNEVQQTLAAGESDDDTLIGGCGEDQLWGGLGNDTLDGGDHNDLVMGGDGADTLFGGNGDDEVNGGLGDDAMDGGSGADKLFGGVGNDRLWGGDGNDILLGFTPINDTQQSLLAGESDNDHLWGGAGDDLLIGGLGHDQLWGGDGNDEVQGGEGDDQLYGADGNDRLFGGAQNDTLYGGAGDDVLIGGAATNEAALAPGVSDDNMLYGGAGNDTLLGGVGNDYLDGGAGADHMEGGKGDDTYIVNSVNDVILEQQNEGYDTVIAATHYILNTGIEALRLTEGGTFNGTGNRLDNHITGNNQDNVLDGVTGADTHIGGLGNDVYYVEDVGDQVVELADEGSDTVYARISYRLGSHVENLTLLDFSTAEQGRADGVDILVYGYPKAFELDYMQGNAVAGYRGTCALTAIANLGTQAHQTLSEAQVVQTAIDNGWCVTDATQPVYQRGGSNPAEQQALLSGYGIRNGLVMGYNERAIANLIRGGRGVILGLNAGTLWADNAYLDLGGVNHAVTVTGVACDAATGALNGFYIVDSGRGKVSDMTRYLSLADFRAVANVSNAYAIYTVEPIKLWEENINGTGNDQNNQIAGNRGDNVLTGGKGDDTVAGGAGNDTYVFTLGNGQDTVVENDATPGNIDVLQLTHINQTNLWFRQVGDSLHIDVMGTSDQIIVKDWYAAGSSGTDHHVERIQTADGLTLYNTDVDALVQAMAIFEPPASAQTRWINGQSMHGATLLTVTH